jgi:hypothetical protein
VFPSESLTELIEEPPATSHPTEQNNRSPLVTFEVNGRDSEDAPVPLE